MKIRLISLARSEMALFLFAAIYSLGIQAADFQVDTVEIVTTGMQLPGGTTTISGLGTSSIDDGTVVLMATGQDFSQQGIYRFNASAGLQIVADTHTPTPNGSGNFSQFNQELPTISNGDVAFWGCCNQLGVFRNRMGITQTMADRSDTIPGSTNTFSNFSDPVTDGVEVAFAGFNVNTSERGAYKTSGGALTILADDNDLMPGSGGVPFLGFRDFSMDNGFVTFIGEAANLLQGIYLHDGTSVSRVVDSNMLFPGTTDRFSQLAIGGVDDGNVVFWGRGRTFSTQGIFLKPEDQVLELIVDSNTPLPGGGGDFKGVFNPRIDGGNILFTGQNDANEIGIYLSSEGAISELIAKGDPLGSSTLNQVFGLTNLDGNRFAFTARLDNGENGIYLAEFTAVPVPAAVWLFGSTLVLLGWIRRKTA